MQRKKKRTVEEVRKANKVREDTPRPALRGHTIASLAQEGGGCPTSSTISPRRLRARRPTS